MKQIILLAIFHVFYTGVIGQNCPVDFKTNFNDCPQVRFTRTEEVTWNEGVIPSYTYYFGDGDSSQNNYFNKSHYYDKNGTYEFCVKLSTSEGCNVTKCDTITVTCHDTLVCHSKFKVLTDSCPVMYFIDSSYTNNNEDTISFWHYDFGDGTTSFDRNPSHTFTEDGKHEVCLTASNWGGCDSSYSYCDTVTIPCSGITSHKLISKDNIFLSPNPASSKININNVLSVSFDVFDNVGALIFSGIGSSINVQDLAPGSYILKLVDENKTFRFIKE